MAIKIGEKYGVNRQYSRGEQLVYSSTSLRCLRGSESCSHSDPWWWLIETKLYFKAGRSELHAWHTWTHPHCHCDLSLYYVLILFKKAPPSQQKPQRNNNSAVQQWAKVSLWSYQWKETKFLFPFPIKKCAFSSCRVFSLVKQLDISNRFVYDEFELEHISVLWCEYYHLALV